jgi:hypothetical protein
MTDDFKELLGYSIVIIFLAYCAYTYYDGIEAFQLNCIVSNVDGNKYCVREREKLQDAADLLAKVTTNCKKLVEYLCEKHTENEAVMRLKKGFNSNKIMETLPTSSYTAYSENKGEKVAFCLNKKKEDNNNLIDLNTLTFVAFHEMAHIMTVSIGHKPEFWENFKFLLENAKAAGIHDPVNYGNKPTEYCGMTITDNPYYTH